MKANVGDWLVIKGAADIAAEPEVSVWDLAALDILVARRVGRSPAWTAPPARTAAAPWPPTAYSTSRC